MRTMYAKYDTTCPVCGVKFRKGVSEIEMRAEFGTWVHRECLRTEMSDEYLSAWNVVKGLRGPKLRKMAMTLEIKVTEGKKYADDMDLRYACAQYAIKSTANKNRFNAAHQVATGIVNANSFSANEGQEYIDEAKNRADNYSVSSSDIRRDNDHLRGTAAVDDDAPPIDTAELVMEIVNRLDGPIRTMVEASVGDHVQSLSPTIAEIAANAAVEATKHLQRHVHVVTDPSGKKAGGRIEGLVHQQFDKLLRMVAADVNVWVAGPAGSGKTTGARQVASALGLDFYFNGAIANEYKLSGFVDAQGRVVSTAFREAWTRGGLYLFDEVDASLPAAVLAFNAALSGDLADFPGEPRAVKKHDKFRVVAAANTWGYGGGTEYVGRSKMDAAFLDRFVQLEWPYDENIELAMAGGNESWCRLVQKIRRNAGERGLKVVISPRATEKGAKLIASGFSVEEALEATVFAKMPRDSRQALGH